MELKLANDDENKKVNRPNQEDRGMAMDLDLDNPWEKENLWEKELHTEPVQMRATIDELDEPSSKAKPKNESILLKITKALLYIGVIIEIILCAWCYVNGGIHMYSNLQKVSWVFSAVSIFCIVDSILVIFISKCKWPLFIWACIFPFFYPMSRKKYLEGSSGSATLICIGLIVGYVALILQMTTVTNKYGNVFFMEDDVTRAAVAELYDQAATTNVKLGIYISNSMITDTASMYEKGDKTYLVLIGSGKQSLDANNNIVTSSEMATPTSLTFAKNRSGKYELVSAIFLSKQLDAQHLEEYKKDVLHN